MKCRQLQPCNPPLDDDDDDGDEHHSMLLLQHQVLDEEYGEYLILNIVVSCSCCDFCYLM